MPTPGTISNYQQAVLVLGEDTSVPTTSLYQNPVLILAEENLVPTTSLYQNPVLILAERRGRRIFTNHNIAE